jgi:pyruvate/2-oxoglutarate dehydrogenase complex dihydrolipoamide dehydrogenase (E3) component
MADTFDAVVIGAGPAGEVAAGELADGGMKVAVAERELVAGECSYWACMPSKTLLRPGEALVGAQRAPGAREAVKGGLDAGQVFAWRNYMVSDYDDTHHAQWLLDKGIEIVRGSARIEGPKRVQVGDRMLETERICIATGSDPLIPPIDGIGEIEPWTNREATGAKEVHGRLVILGGGPVGCEMAQAFLRLGSSVAVVERGKRLLAREGCGGGEELREALESEGIDVHCGVGPERVAKRGDGVSVTLDDGAELHGDRLLVATGRKPRLDDLDVGRAGITPGKKGIEVDERCRAADTAWAIGDVTGVALFTHVGKYQARIAAADMLGREARADYRAIPRVVFTDPEVGGTGMTEEQAEEEGIEIAIGRAELKEIARSATYLRDYDKLPSSLTLIADKGRGVLIGAYGVGPEAGEWIGQATLAIRAGLPLAVLRDTIQPFPTFSEVFVNALRSLDA